MLRPLLVAVVAAGIVPSTSFGGTAPPGGGDPRRVAESALERLADTDLDAWGYRMRTVTTSGERVEEHDPSRAEHERWRLVEVDGREPTDAERRGYRNEKLAESDGGKETRGGDGEERSVGASIDLETLELISRGEDRLVFRFGVEDDGSLDLTTSAGGTLVVRTDPPFVESMVIRNHDTVKGPMRARIEEFLTEMTWTPDPATGAVLPVDVHTRVRGKVLFVKSIDEDARVSYSDWRPPRTTEP